MIVGSVVRSASSSALVCSRNSNSEHRQRWQAANSSGLLQCHRPMSTSSDETEEAKRQLEIQALQARHVDKSLLRELPFNDYIKIRKRIGIYSLLFGGFPSFFTGIVGTAYACAAYIPNLIPDNPEQVEPIMGMDPMMFATATTTVSGFAGFFVGTVLFRKLWRVFFKQHAAMLDARETDFRLRIAQHRRGGHEFSHDYYGDKIKSLADYKQWLRDQRVAEKKLNGVIDA